MKVHTDNPQYKTARQWAKMGYLPRRRAPSVRMWTNHFCGTAYDYYSPADVEPADPERLQKFFEKENEREKAQARERYAKKAERTRQAAASEEIAPHISELIATYTAAPELTRTLVIDTETTGLDPDRNEILQLSIIDGAGVMVYDSYFKPAAKSWNEAQKINHIRPADVQTAPRFSQELPRICSILARAEKIIGYNLPFDLAFLRASGVIIPDSAEQIDVMQLFAPIYGEYSEKYDGYKWQKLTTAADWYGYEWTGKAHNSLADCYATLFVYNHIHTP